MESDLPPPKRFITIVEVRLRTHGSARACQQHVSIICETRPLESAEEDGNVLTARGCPNVSGRD